MGLSVRFISSEFGRELLCFLALAFKFRLLCGDGGLFFLRSDSETFSFGLLGNALFFYEACGFKCRLLLFLFLAQPCSFVLGVDAFLFNSGLFGCCLLLSFHSAAFLLHFFLCEFGRSFFFHLFGKRGEFLLLLLIRRIHQILKRLLEDDFLDNHRLYDHLSWLGLWNFGVRLSYRLAIDSRVIGC